MEEQDACASLSQSKYILAKYRIVVEDNVETSQLQGPVWRESVTGHRHAGPKAIEPNLRGGQFRANKDTICQCLWCFCVPCYSANLCWIKFCEMCYDDCSKSITEKEEVSEMKMCTMGCCAL